MSVDRSKSSDADFKHELLRLVCDEHDLTHASAALRARLSADPEAQAEFAEMQALVRELQDAMGPDPLPEAVVQRIDARLGRGPRGRTRVLWRPIRLAALAAAAVLALAVVQHLVRSPASPEAPLAVALSPADAAEIVAVYGLLSWQGHVDYSIEQVSSEVKNIEQRMEREPGVETGLPWSREDDWDVPSVSQGNGSFMEMNNDSHA
jgi:anti-sigma factor RsiW